MGVDNRLLFSTKDCLSMTLPPTSELYFSVHRTPASTHRSHSESCNLRCE